MAELTQQKPIIRITFDEMEAYMLLPEPEQGTGYTDAQIPAGDGSREESPQA